MSTVGWFEIIATEPELGKQFYQRIFDWQFRSFGDELATVTAPGAAAPMGALSRGERDALWIGVVDADVAATAPRLESLGATIIQPPERTAAGYTQAVVADVRGNLIGLYQPAAQENSPTGPPVPNSTAWFEIGTTDFAATREFYERAFGWSYERDEAAEGVAYYSVRSEQSPEPSGGTMDLAAIAGAADYAIPGLMVTDVADLLRRCESAGGGRVLDPITDGNGVVVGQFTDPFGNRWSAFAPPANS